MLTAAFKLYISTVYAKKKTIIKPENTISTKLANGALISVFKLNSSVVPNLETHKETVTVFKSVTFC